jgi:type III restriction enzyme
MPINDPETKEKKLIGELWEKKMGGKGLYIMAIKDDEGKDVYAQLVEKLKL